jgi:GTP cyclohydrolase II
MLAVASRVASHRIVHKAPTIPLNNPSFPNLTMSACTVQIAGHITEHAIIAGSGNFTNANPPWLRLNSACFTGDLFGDRRCDCSEQMQRALAIINDDGGFLIYHLDHEGRALGLTRKIAALALTDGQGLSTFAASKRVAATADARTYDAAVIILKYLGIHRVRLLTNNPLKIAALTEAGIDVVETRRLISLRKDLAPLLEAKRREQNHLID